MGFLCNQYRPHSVNTWNIVISHVVRMSVSDWLEFSSLNSYSVNNVFVRQDCAWLTEFVASSPRLRSLEVCRSHVDDVRLLMLSEALIVHEGLTELRFPYNVLSDDSARILARHLDHTGPRIQLVSR